MSIDQPQAGAVPPTDRANGLATYFGVLFGPGEAFDTLARVPMWGWACVLGLIISIVAAIIGLPATLHIAQTAQQTAIAQAPADQQQAMRDGISHFTPFMAPSIIISVLIVTWIIWLIVALFVLAAAERRNSAPLGHWRSISTRYRRSALSSRTSSCASRGRRISTSRATRSCCRPWRCSCTAT